MKQPTFVEGVYVALLASISASVLFDAMISILPGVSVIKLLIALLSLSYLSYLLSRSQPRLGRVTLIVSWSLAAAANWLFAPSLVFYGLVHLGLIWLARALYRYRSVLSALADLGLNAAALAAGVWAAYQSESLFITSWCFFLIQALFVYIPTRLPGRKASPAGVTVNDQRFQQAHRAAEMALQKLSISGGQK